MGTDKFAIPELLFNPGLVDRYPSAAARLRGASAGAAEGLQGLQHMAHDCISK